MEASRPSDDTVDLPKMELDTEPGGKTCCQCGKDLRGHRRFKDSIGYWCKDCHRVDKARHTVAEGRCPDCGRMRPLDKLYQTEDGSQVCKSCMNERVEKAQRYAAKAAVENQVQSSERTKLYTMIAVVVILVGILVWQQLGKLFGD